MINYHYIYIYIYIYFFFLLLEIMRINNKILHPFFFAKHIKILILEISFMPPP